MGKWMKNSSSFVVALGLVAGVVSVASASELTINGEARWRGVYHTNYQDTTDASQDKIQNMDQRYRLNVNLKINDDVKINTRLVLADQILGNDQPMNFSADRANMVIKTLGGTWTIGRQDVSWGNKFLGWGISADRVRASYRIAATTLGGYLEKNVEGNYSNGDGDIDIWGAFAVGKVAATRCGLLLNYVTYDANQAAGSAIQKGDSGYLIDPYFVGKIGPATVLGEFVYEGGDIFRKNNFDKAPYGGFVAATVDLATVTVKGLAAYYKDNNGKAAGGSGRDCDNDFAPSLLIGTCSETAMVDFGGTTNPNKIVAEANDRTYLVGAGVDFKASDKITVGALVGYLGASQYGYGGNKQSLIEVDLTASYQLAQNATYRFGIAYGKPKNFSAADDNIWGIGNAVEAVW